MGLLGEGAEIGTQAGDYAAHLRRHWGGRRLLCVDPWKPYPDYPGMTQADHDRVRAVAERNLREAGGEFSMIPMESVAAAKYLTTAGMYLDFVYIDAQHDYASVKADIAAWLPLVREGGIIAGHDYVPDGWHVHGEPHVAHDKPVPGKPCALFGVKRAVDESFLKDSIMLTATDADDGWRSWMVIK